MNNQYSTIRALYTDEIVVGYVYSLCKFVDRLDYNYIIIQAAHKFSTISAAGYIVYSLIGIVSQQKLVFNEWNTILHTCPPLMLFDLRHSLVAKAIPLGIKLMYDSLVCQIQLVMQLVFNQGHAEINVHSKLPIIWLHIMFKYAYIHCIILQYY